MLRKRAIHHWKGGDSLVPVVLQLFRRWPQGLRIGTEQREARGGPGVHDIVYHGSQNCALVAAPLKRQRKVSYSCLLVFWLYPTP